MAKGNMLLGQSRGKLGDVVFTRMNGEQIARPRVRHPRNPQTNKQLYQRAVMATIMQAYSAGIEIFDHSFEGKAVGAENQRYFMKINAKKLRADIAADLNAAEYPAQYATVVAPGVSTPTLNKLQVSEGSIAQNPFRGGSVPLPIENDTPALYCQRYGLVPGDVFTLVLFTYSNDELFSLEGVSDNSAKLCAGKFYYYRIRIKDSAFTDDTVITWREMDRVFDQSSVESIGPVQNDISGWIAMGGLTPEAVYDRFASGGSSFAVIRSRYNLDLRSTEQMVFDNRYYQPGIASKYALQAWKQGTQELGDSDLILEGGDV